MVIFCNPKRGSYSLRQPKGELREDLSNRRIISTSQLCTVWLTLLLTAAASAATLQVPSASYPTIQSAIDDAIAGDEIIVAAGTYPEKINFLGKPITLRSADGKDVTTIDATGLMDSVVKCVTSETAATILDGFTITGGTGDVSVGLSGGGMLNIGSSPTVLNCIFIGNIASTFGGGIFNRNASPTITNCELRNNSGVRGGGMCNDTGSQPIITGCLFQGNSSNDGAGMYNYEASPIIRDCIFFDNPGNFGGAVCNENFSSPTFTNCLFEQNVGASSGGGIANLGDCSPTITNCIFRENRASEGGAIANDMSCNPTVRSCLFVGNSARRIGGAIMNFVNSMPQITNSTFVGNTADFGSVIDEDASQSTIENSIFWDNLTNAFGGTNNPVVNYTIVQGGFVGGVGNLDIDPQFLDADGPDDDPMTFDDNNYQVACNSPAIDTGNPAFIALPNELALNTQPRILGNNVDLGAYEFLPLTPGDFNNDTLIDLNDVAKFYTCMSDNPPSTNCLCIFDLDESDTITLEDFGIFRPLITGP